MSILIKGMEMPKNDDDYVIVTVYGDGGVVYGPLNRPHVRHKNRAVTIPPHGRLIDADALMKTFLPREFTSDTGDAMEILDHYQTIIPASEEDGDGDD